MNLELAKRLKAAGFPQDGITSDAHWRTGVSALNPDKWYRVSWGRVDLDGEHYAAPNSDELLAEIQRRWPDAKSIDVGSGAGGWLRADGWLAHRLDDNDDGCTGKGATMLEALSELYIKLDNRSTHQGDDNGD